MAETSTVHRTGIGRWVNLDPVVRHLRSQLRSLPIENYLVGLLPGHVATNAIFRKRMPWPGEGCRSRFVAAKAALRKLGHVVLRCMNVVASEAGHVRGAEATALFQQLDLVTVNIEGCAGIRWRKVHVLVQRFAGQIGERGTQRLAVSGVTPRAKIHLTIA